MSMSKFDEKRGIVAEYEVYLEAIQVHLDCSWSEGSVSFYQGSRDRVNRLFTKRRCPKAFLWRPCQPKIIWSDVVIEYGEEGWEHSDTVVTWQEMWETVEKVEYNSKGEAHIQIICSSSFGTSTTIIKIQKIQCYSTIVCQNVIVEFGNSEDCLRFIQHGIYELRGRNIVPNENDDALPIIDDVCKTVAPLAFEYRHAELAAIHRGLPENDFYDEITEPATALIPHRGSTPTENHARPCFLMLHLDVFAWLPRDTRISLILDVHWSATDNPRAFPSRSNPFQYLSNFQLKFPSTASEDCDDDSSLPLTISFSAQGIQVLDGTSSVFTRNSLTINGPNRSIVVNYIGAIMGDGFFGPIHRSNIGGTNNNNRIY